MLVARTADLLCPLALSDMSYSGIDTSPSPVPPSTASNKSSDNDAVLLTVVIVMAVVSLVVCGFIFLMYTKEKAGEPMFMPLTDQDTHGLPKEDEKKVGPTEVGMTVVSK